MIDVYPFDLPLATPYRWSKGTQHSRAGLIFRVDLDGAVGWGETAPPPHLPVDGEKLKSEALGVLQGLDLHAEDFIQQLDTRAPAPRVRTGITTAWLAARAAAEGLSFAAYLGKDWRSPVSEVPVNGLVGEADPAAVVERCGQIWDQGIRTFKIKCTDDHALDDQRVAAIREAFPDATLRLDPNEAWTPENMLSRLEHMSAHDIQYCEEPIPSAYTLEDLERFARLREQSPIPIALDQSVTSTEITKRIIDAKAADVLILKSQAMGGFDHAVEIIRLAEAADILSVMTSSLETAVGLTASLHGAAILPTPLPACGLSLGRFYARDIAVKPQINEGIMQVPAGPGLGLGEVTVT